MISTLHLLHKNYVKIVLVFLSINVLLFIKYMNMKNIGIFRNIHIFSNEIYHIYEGNVVANLGEGGMAIEIATSEKYDVEYSIKKHGFNLYHSNRISPKRLIPDNRNSLCMKMNFLEKVLPSASVIITISTEPFSTLLRTVWSVINRSPSNSLKEIILVDDYSRRVVYGEKFELYLSYYFPAYVKFVRLNKYHGRFRARIEGSKLATGDVLIFLDGYCEVNIHWMVPLLHRINQNRTLVLMPNVQKISERNLEIPENNETMIGGIDWNGNFILLKEFETQNGQVNLTAPFRSLNTVGGLFAIDKKHFLKLWNHKQGLEVSGESNQETTFRIWVCDLTLETIPCSIVNRIFTPLNTYFDLAQNQTFAHKSLRITDVINGFRMGGKGHRIYEELRRKKMGSQCRSFRWYRNNYFSDAFYLDDDSIAYGRLWILNSNLLCIDTLGRKSPPNIALGVYACHKYIGNRQFMAITKSGQLRNEKLCASVSNLSKEGFHAVDMGICDPWNRSQQWKLTETSQLIHNVTGKCLDGYDLKNNQDVLVFECNGSPSQYWKFDHYNPEFVSSTVH